VAARHTLRGYRLVGFGSTMRSQAAGATTRSDP
jgi:hypothetical protein